MFCMQVPLYAEVQEPNCTDENPVLSLSCFTRNFRDMLIPFQVVSDSKSKVFGGSNLFLFYVESN